MMREVLVSAQHGLCIAHQGIHINRKDRQDNDLLPVGHSFLVNESLMGNCK
jgi:hypothetical protein